MKTTDLFKWTKRAAGFALFFAIAVGCGGSNCDGNSPLDSSGTASVRAINFSGGVAEHLDFFAHGSKIADNVGWQASGPWSSVKAGTVPIASRLHTSGTSLASKDFSMSTGRRYWVLAYDGLPTLRLMATEVHTPPAGEATVILLNGDHLRGMLDIHITSGGPPTAESKELITEPGGSSGHTGMIGRTLPAGSHTIYGVKAGTLEVIWSLLVTLEAGGYYLVTPVSEGDVPYDPDLVRIE